RHRELAAAAEREAVDRRDHRLAEVLDHVEDVLAGERGLAAAGRRLHRELVDVRACDERLFARAGHDDRAHILVTLQIEHRAAQLVNRLRVQRVEHLGPVDRDQADAVSRAVALEKKVVEGHDALARAGTDTSASRARAPTEEIRRTSSRRTGAARASRLWR